MPSIFCQINFILKEDELEDELLNLGIRATVLAEIQMAHSYLMAEESPDLLVLDICSNSSGDELKYAAKMVTIAREQNVPIMAALTDDCNSNCLRRVETQSGHEIYMEIQVVDVVKEIFNCFHTQRPKMD
jgi:hypothetical protein